MFGYVVVNKPELKIKEFDIYKGYYCGLCRALHNRYGFRGQITLTYDMTFLSMLLSSLYDSEMIEEDHRCVAHPTKKHHMIRSPYTDYVADMNILLSYFKAKDDWHDDHSILKLTYSELIKKKVPSYQEKADAIQDLLVELGTREEQNETDIDTMAGLFGKIMAIVFSPKKDSWAPHLEKMGFFLGKFIYILDAYDDLDDDIKKNRYNPFKSICNEPDFDDKIKSMLTMMMAESSKVFEFLPIIENANILRNILYAGVWTVYYQCRNKRNENSGD